MFLEILYDYRLINIGLSGSQLTDFLIQECIKKKTGRTCSVRRTKKGKPVIFENGSESDIHVSVSHSEDTFGCVVAHDNVGLDIQHERNADEIGIARRYYNESEITLVESCINSDVNSEFFRIWARKEAYSKYTGEGLADIMRKQDVINRNDVRFMDKVIHDKSGKDCYIAICVGKGVKIDEIQISCREQNR